MTKERQQDSNGKSEIDMMRSCEKRGQKIATIVIIWYNTQLSIDTASIQIHTPWAEHSAPPCWTYS